MRGDEHVRAIVRDARAATPEDWDTEYLDLILSIKVVDSLDEAIEFIARHGSASGRRDRDARPGFGRAL